MAEGGRGPLAINGLSPGTTSFGLAMRMEHGVSAMKLETLYQTENLKLLEVAGG